MQSESRPHYVAALLGVPTFELILCDDEAAVIDAIPRCDAIVMGSSRYSRGIAAALQSGDHAIEWIQLASTGIDNLVQFGLPQGIVVTNAPFAPAPTVAEHALALMLAGTRQIVEIDRARAQYLERDAFTPELSSVEGQTLLIVGYGPIGQAIAKRALAFDMQVVAVTRRPSSIADAGVEAHDLDDLESLLPRADIVLVALALNSETRGLIGHRVFDRMKPSAWLINVARGDLVDQVALIESLKAGKLFGAALDVTDIEPLPATSPLRNMRNVLVTPHIGGIGSVATQRRLAEIVVANLHRRANREPLRHVVDLGTRQRPFHS